MSSPDIAGILDSSKELDRLRKEQEEVLIEINKMHKKLQATPEVVEKAGDTSLSRLKYLYTHAKELSENEVTICGVLLSQLDALLPSGPPGQRRRIDDNPFTKTVIDRYDAFYRTKVYGMTYGEQKRKRMKNDPDLPRLSPSTFANLKGQQVAARVTGDDAEKDEWFIVKVTHFDRETKEVEVLDEEPDDEEGSGQRKYKLPMSHIIPFPRQNDPSTAHDFPPGRHVLAVYPGTTALYKATVVNSHRKRKTDDYLLEFDDDEEDGAMPQRTVPYFNVVPLPEGHKQ